MSKDKLNKLAAYEKAIAEKYGEEAVANPKSNWNEEKEKLYLEEMKDFYNKQNKKLFCLRGFPKEINGRCLPDKI